MRGNNLEDELIEPTAPKVKPCKYPSCTNTLPLESPADYCEVCRVLIVRNAIALAVDPTVKTPPQQSVYLAFSQMTRDEFKTAFLKINDMYGRLFPKAIHLMDIEQLQAAVVLVEKTYLEFQKTIKAHELSLPSTKRNWADLNKELTAARKAPATKSKSKKTTKLTPKEKAIKLLGKEAADELFKDDEDFSALL